MRSIDVLIHLQGTRSTIGLDGNVRLCVVCATIARVAQNRCSQTLCFSVGNWRGPQQNAITVLTHSTARAVDLHVRDNTRDKGRTMPCHAAGFPMVHTAGKTTRLTQIWHRRAVKGMLAYRNKSTEERFVVSIGSLLERSAVVSWS